MNIITVRNYTKKEKKLLRLLLDQAISEGKLESTITEHELHRLALQENTLIKCMQNHLMIEEQGTHIYLQVFTGIEKKANGDYTFSFLKDVLQGQYAHRIEMVLSLLRKDSLMLYQKMLQKGTSFYLDLDECKALFSCQGLYPRFYDFERFILQPIVDDFHQHTNCQLSYHKVKNETYENAKIAGIEFLLEDKEIQDSQQIDAVYHTKLSNPYQMQNEIYAFIEEHQLKVFNEYFFSPDLFLSLQKIKRGGSLLINPKLRISCDQKGNVKMEFFHIDKE